MQQGTPTIIYEDNHLIVVNKPHGWLVHGDKTKDLTIGDWLKDYIKKKYHKPGDVFLGTVHRLDRPVGGLMVFARTSKALERLNKLFATKSVKKEYVALIQNEPSSGSGTLIHWLLKNPKSNKVDVSLTQIDGQWKQAVTNYKITGSFKKYLKVELEPVTGRSHQLRAQLSFIKCPIVGDLKYGSKTKCMDENIALKCVGLSFVHPVTKEDFSVKIENIEWNV